MHAATATINLERPAEGDPLDARLSWLLLVNADESRRRRLFRSSEEEQELLLMRHPLDPGRAYGLFGLMLGLFPPAAIFIKMFGYGASGYNAAFWLFFLCLLMNLTCAVAGYGMGRGLGRVVGNTEQRGWSAMLLLLPLIGACWGAVTGFAGGLIFVGIGAIFGAVFAIPVGALCFTLFAPLHRMLARGGMIDARHFWPLASGATLFAAALILGL